jgi:phage terminase large subunit GpA-like protein
MEIVGHGIGFRTWSLLYKVFPGAVDNAYEGAWVDLNDWAAKGGMAMKRADGRAFSTNLAFIDCGDGTNYDVVYAFAARWANTFPSKGFSALQKQKNEKGDEAGPHNFKRYRRAKTEKSGDVEFYEISTNFYKTHLYNHLKIERQPVDPQKPGFCSFPRDRGEKFFKMLTAEEKRTDGSFHSSGRRNEALDCRVMAACASDVFLDTKVMALRVAAKAKGASDSELAKINHVFVLDLLAKQTIRV